MRDVEVPMTDDTEPWPPITFKVLTASGKFVGYGSDNGLGAYEVYLPGGDDEGFMGVVLGSNVEFSSGVEAGSVKGTTIKYSDGSLAGTIDGEMIYDECRRVVAATAGTASVEARGGAVLLLIFNRWFLPDGSPNPEVR